MLASNALTTLLAIPQKAHHLMPSSFSARSWGKEQKLQKSHRTSWLD